MLDKKISSSVKYTVTGQFVHLIILISCIKIKASVFIVKWQPEFQNYVRPRGLRCSNLVFLIKKIDPSVDLANW
jgi:hypothetical protein